MSLFLHFCVSLRCPLNLCGDHVSWNRHYRCLQSRSSEQSLCISNRSPNTCSGIIWTSLPPKQRRLLIIMYCTIKPASSGFVQQNLWALQFATLDNEKKYLCLSILRNPFDESSTFLSNAFIFDVIVSNIDFYRANVILLLENPEKIFVVHHIFPQFISV